MYQGKGEIVGNRAKREKSGVYFSIIGVGFPVLVSEKFSGKFWRTRTGIKTGAYFQILILENFSEK